ncbi:unnamed protein product [Effrenium voratum]|uniref:CAP-Gly domain-containing protein n=1 Tax=Effrenium voratum TaxID=2562239 RepID=A0AA36JCK1_9DINO|nr:unnamed protein product [Effrenium voratum]CAJ1454416.1 unnamed protein product [Effrenium voratum]
MLGTKSEDWPSMHQSQEMQALRDYVTAADGYRYANQASTTLRLDVTHSNLIQKYHDIVFDSTMTVGRVKEKLYFHGGTPAADQELYLRRGGGDTLFLWDDRKTLGECGVKNGMEIHIKDTNPHSISAHGGLEDVSQVVKYEMADEEYDRLENSVRAIKRREEEKAEAERAARRAAGEVIEEEPGETVEEVSARIPLDSRCEVAPGGRRGAVAFVGLVKGAKGVWIGVALDEPQGNNDGAKAGERYFSCKGDRYGCFARPENVEVGDFPELDPFASDEEF